MQMLIIWAFSFFGFYKGGTSVILKTRLVLACSLIQGRVEL